MQGNPSKYPAHSKLTGMLTTVTEELPDTPLFYNLASLAKTLKATAPKMETMRDALVNAGYRASPTHCTPGGFKTDATPEVRTWLRLSVCRRR